LKVPVIGDWGDSTSSGIANQKTTAEVLAEWCEKTQPDNFIWSVGDNFYENGVTEPTSPRFDSSWKNVYNQPSLIDKVWFQSLGNHDHGNFNPGDGREWNQVISNR
jgi:tartrate-resistant acid phosphatase type 5